MNQTELGVENEECDICNLTGRLVKFKCHDKHIACISCALKIDICPYCRKNLFTGI